MSVVLPEDCLARWKRACGVNCIVSNFLRVLCLSLKLALMTRQQKTALWSNWLPEGVQFRWLSPSNSAASGNWVFKYYSERSLALKGNGHFDTALQRVECLNQASQTGIFRRPSAWPWNSRQATLFWSNKEARYFLRDLWFSQGCCWEFTSSGMWRRVTRWAVLDVSKDSCAFVFRVKREQSYNQDVGNCNTYCIILELKLSVLMSACADVCWRVLTLPATDSTRVEHEGSEEIIVH